MRQVRLRALACLPALLVAGGAAGVVAAAGTGAGSPPAERLDAEARGAAEAQAAALAPQIELPPGAAQTPSEPAEAAGALARSPVSQFAESYAVDDSGWAAVPEPQTQVMAYVREHLPAGVSYSYEYQPGPGLTGLTIAFAPQRSGPVSEKWGYVTLLSLPGARTDVRTDAVALWVPAPRPIPAGSRLLTVSARVVGPRSPYNQRRVITSGARIEAVRRLIDVLPVSRPSLRAASCPAQFGAVTLSFYFERRAPQTPSAIVRAPIGGCGGWALTVAGTTAQEREEGGGALRGVAKLTRLRLPHA